MAKIQQIAYGVTAVSHAALFWPASELARAVGVPHAGWVAAGFCAVGFVLFHGRVRLLADDRPIGAWRRRLLELPYYVHWCAAFFAAPFILVALLVWLGLGMPEGIVPAAIVAAPYPVGLLLAGYGVLVRRRMVRTRRLEVPIAALDPTFDGYRIAVVSDLHVGSLAPSNLVRSMREAVQREDPDLVALLGDYATSGTRFHEAIADAVADLPSRDGTFAVMGNHDYFGEGEPLLSYFAERGIRTLRNESITLRRDVADRTGQPRAGSAAAELDVVGVDDVYTKRANVEKATRSLSPSVPAIALAHDPTLFESLSRRPVQLVLSGHTHWGQLAVPFLAERLNLARISNRYHAGTFIRRGCMLAISSGLGTTGPPIRLGAAPEVLVVVLRAKPAPQPT